MIAAGARIHARHQHKVSRKIQGDPGSCYRDLSFFQWLAKPFQDIALEFRKFIQEKDPVVGQRYFSRLRITTASDHSSITDGVMRGSKRPLGYEVRIGP